MNRSALTAAEVLIQCLENEGVEVVFGVPGGPLTPFYEALSQSKKIRHVLAKHEEGAAFMANGYARVSRKLGVCCATSGPGGTNALTAIASSTADSVPVLIITAQVATSNFGAGAAQDGSPLGIDLVQIYKPATKFSAMLAKSSRIQDLVQRAVRIAQTGRPGAVHINLPVDLTKQPSDYVLIKREEYLIPNKAIDQLAIKKALTLLINAKNPMILAGTGVLASNALDSLQKFADRTKIPVATTPKAKGVFPESHPLSLGVLGLSGHAQAESYFNSPSLDALMVIGTSLGETVTYNWKENLSAPIIHIDVDPYEIGKNYPATIGIVGDARLVLEEALNIFEKSYAAMPGRHADPLCSLRNTIPRHIEFPAIDLKSKPIKPQWMIHELRSVIPGDTLLFVDIGNCMMWFGHYFNVPIPGTYFINLGFGAMGHAVAAAAGAQIAAPDRSVIVVTGDAAFAMNGMEVHTAAEHQLPVIWIVMNNSGHGMVHQGEMVLRGNVVSQSKFSNTIDFAKLGEALGALSWRVESAKEFNQAISLALSSKQPAVIDVLIDCEEIPPGLSQRAQALKKAFANNKTASGMPGLST